MILYNTLMGLCAGLVLLVTSNFLKKVEANQIARDSVYSVADVRGHGIALLVVGVPLTALSFMMAVTWPLTVNPPINIVFAEPSLILGCLATFGGWYIISRLQDLVTEVLYPVTWVVGAVGLMLLASSLAIFRFNLVGDAPPMEPITGQVQGWENTTFGIVYLTAALSCLLVPFISGKLSSRAVRYGWNIVGIFFLLFASLNYYTHVGLLTCTVKGVCLPW